MPAGPRVPAEPGELEVYRMHRVYSVKDDIPIMLVDEAMIESA